MLSRMALNIGLDKERRHGLAEGDAALSRRLRDNDTLTRAFLLINEKR